MRISGYGTGPGSDQPRDREARKDAFRRRRRPGDRLSGTMLGWERPGLAWVRVEGQEFLAAIESAPEPGQTLHFLVTALFPDIVLKELGGAALTSTALGLLAQRLLAGRDRFEDLTRANRERLTFPALPAAQRKEQYLREIERIPEALSLLHGILDSQSEINALLAQRQGGRWLYLPWLMPAAEGLEAALLPSAPDADALLSECVLSGAFDTLGAFEARLYFRPSQTRCRIFLEKPAHGPTILSAFHTLTSAAPIECLGFGLLRPGPRGALKELFNPGPGRLSAGLDARV